MTVVALLVALQTALHQTVGYMIAIGNMRQIGSKLIIIIL